MLNLIACKPLFKRQTFTKEMKTKGVLKVVPIMKQHEIISKQSVVKIF